MNLKKYKEIFNEYASKTHIFLCPSEFGTITNNDVTMFVLLGEIYKSSTVSALNLFVKTFREILKISQDAGLKLCSIEQGSLKLTFQLPVFVVQDIFPLSNEQEVELSNCGVCNLWFIYQFSVQQKQVKLKLKFILHLHAI